MGPPLAPELFRVCTAYLLTIYFDDVAATCPPDDLTLRTYNLKETEPNQTQDAPHDPETKNF